MKKKKKWISVVAGVLVLVMGGTIVFSEPGSSKDPLVTMSYVDEKIVEIKNYIDGKIANVNTSINERPSVGNSETTSAMGMEVVELKMGESIIGENGTEIILRAGNAVAIGSELGGVSDVTVGKDIDTNEKIEKNHHLIIPRSDGRGVYSKGNTVFMVRGNFRIE